MTAQPFDTIVEEHGQRVLRICRGLLGAEDAQDAWSETFLAAMRAYPDLRPDSNVGGWLATIAHNKSIDVLRVRRRTPRPVADVPELGVWDAAPVEGDTLRRRLEALPPKQRGAVVYRYLADLSYAEVADLLDCSEAAARRNAADGIKSLRATQSEGDQK